MEEKKSNGRRRTRSRNRLFNGFTVVYLSVLLALLILSAWTLSYVRGSLEEYEASQPENVLFARIEALDGSTADFEQLFSFEELRTAHGATEAEIAQFQKDFLAGEISFREDYSVTDAEKKVYHVLCDGVKVAEATLKHLGQEVRMLVFTMDRWEVERMEAVGYACNLTAPPSAVIKNNGKVLTGEMVDGNVVYDIRSLSALKVEICDILGNSVAYDANNLPTFTDYQITVPSNYTIMGAEAVPLELATVEDIPELEYAKEYCPELPGRATYRLSLLTSNPDLKILDQNGKEIAFSFEDRKFTLTEPVGQDTLPSQMNVNPLEIAKLWSQFMTADLSGANYGYGQLSPYLIKGSYLQSVAWKWATGIDITFTSSHTLKDPPFQVEEASNYILYNENCFSCDIRLEKTMVLTRTGEEVTDKIHSRFYFVRYDDTDNGVNDPHWVLVDYKEIH